MLDLPSTRRLLLLMLLLPADPPGDRVGDASIPEIQGRSHFSPFAGQRVRTHGTVLAVAGSTAYLQDELGDEDPATSDAVVLALDSTIGLQPGDRVTVTGRVRETIPGGPRTANLTVTTIVGERIEVRGGNAPLPRPVLLGPGGRWPPPRMLIGADELPVDLRDSAQARGNPYDPGADAIDFFESLEGMRVRIAAPVAVSAVETHGGRSSEVWTLPAGGAGVPAVRRTRAGGILLQPGSVNGERVQVQFDSALWPGPVPPLGPGDRMGDVTGVLRYDFGSYELAVTEPFTVRHRRRRPERTGLEGRGPSVTVASYNVLNLSAPPEDDGQRDLLGRHIARHLGAPDIVALQEIQDDSGERDDGTTDATGTLRALAEAVLSAGGPRYQFVDVAPRDGRPGGVPGGNIRNAFLYRPDRVSLERHAALTADRLREAGAADPAAFADGRDPLLGVFVVGGRRLTVINNHLTSRYGSTPVFGAVQPFAQAGSAERAAQAAALRRYVASLLDAAPGAAVVVLGDMNTFEFTDELTRVLPGEPPILHPLAGQVPAADRYTYIFEGNSQMLDHAFVSRSLRAAARLDIVHVNVDFPAMGGVTASDHDPLVVRVTLPGAGAP